MMLFDRFENRYILKGVLAAVDPIHIGTASESVLDPSAIDSPVLKDSRGFPVIPGSSLKGVVRSWFESVLRGAGLYACDVLDHKNCCTAKGAEERKKGLRWHTNVPAKYADSSADGSLRESYASRTAISWESRPLNFVTG